MGSKDILEGEKNKDNVALDILLESGAIKSAKAVLTIKTILVTRH